MGTLELTLSPLPPDGYIRGGGHITTNPFCQFYDIGQLRPLDR